MNEFKPAEMIELLDVRTVYTTLEEEYPESLELILDQWEINGVSFTEIGHLFNIDLNPYLGTEKWVNRNGEEISRNLHPSDFNFKIRKYSPGTVTKFNFLCARVDGAGLLTFQCKYDWQEKNKVYEYTYSGKFIIHWGETE